MSAGHTSKPSVRIRILTPPGGKLFDGIVDVGRFEAGQSYEVGPRLAELLIASGHAALERRQDSRNRRSGDSVF